MTLYLDRSVAKAFKAMGQGYQARINRILETWLQMRMAEKPALQKRLMERVKEAGGCEPGGRLGRHGAALRGDDGELGV